MPKVITETMFSSLESEDFINFIGIVFFSVEICKCSGYIFLFSVFSVLDHPHHVRYKGIKLMRENLVQGDFSRILKALKVP